MGLKLTAFEPIQTEAKLEKGEERIGPGDTSGFHSNYIQVQRQSGTPRKSIHELCDHMLYARLLHVRSVRA